ncbi:MAG: biotin carboxylase N-terminal domain-containing protein [Bacillota bacterium]
MINKLLIANRGEIVSRIIKTCKKMGVQTVAIYSDSDKAASYLEEADESCCIGPSNPLKSYLNIDAIINAMLKTRADAVHPGYGFLAENYAFAEAVVSQGAIWVGPPPSVMKAVESKCYCRQIAAGVDVSVIPGTLSTLAGLKELRQAVQEYGYPAFLKLDKGGGGKGIEVIRDENQLQEVYERVTRIGQMAFGSSECYLEVGVERPRHIEIQFIADSFGQCVCLGERECSVQRRHQKIIEEAPSPVVGENERNTLFAWTRKLSRAMGYEGAGTLEYLRATGGEFYFMEVNARLQVEHPVTEALTGMDIVQKQLEIASGMPLGLQQDDLQISGHAIEARVYAEDPDTFQPSPGKVNRLSFPATNEHIRIDHALYEGGTVSPYYDPLIAKVIAWDETRLKAIQRLTKALREFQVTGIKTTVPLNLHILENKEFQEGNFDTSFLEKFSYK